MIPDARALPAPGTYVPAVRAGCGHMACCGKAECIYLPGTYTPLADIHVDHCIGADCAHCNQEKP